MKKLNLVALSRNEMRNVFGGENCTLTIQGSNGQWITRAGTCKKVYQLVSIGEGISIPQSHSYCDTGLGEVSLTSNGGNSRCS